MRYSQNRPEVAERIRRVVLSWVPGVSIAVVNDGEVPKGALTESLKS